MKISQWVLQAVSAGLLLAVPAIVAADDYFASKPLHVAEDVNGVDLLSGTFRPQLPVLNVPASSNLRLDHIQKLLPLISGTVYPSDGSSRRESYQVQYFGGNSAETFSCIDYECVSGKGNGSTLRPTTFSERFVYVQGGSGQKIVFDQKFFVGTRYELSGTVIIEVGDYRFYPSSVSYPSGERLNYTYFKQVHNGLTYHRPTAITSSLGYVMKLTYVSDDLVNGNWGGVATASIYKSDDLVNAVASRTYSGGLTVTDEMARQWQLGGANNALGYSETSKNFTQRNPRAGVDSLAVVSESLNHGSVTHDGWVTRVTRDGVQWNYRYVAAASVQGDPYKQFSSVTITGPLGYTRTIQTWAPNGSVQSAISSDTDALGRVTSYSYDDALRITRVTLPEGNKVEYGYDDFGNLTSIRFIAKPGSGLADIVESAGYPSTISCVEMSCYRPLWSRDGRGNQTDYTHDATHGGLLTKTEPAGANGLRRHTINEYELVNNLYRLKKTRVCSLYASGANNDCGTATEQVTEYTYWENTFLPLTVTKTNGTRSITAVTSYSYDRAGRVLSVDGPLAGTGDAVYSRYDAAGRKTWDIGALNQAGRRVATRTTYRAADDQPELVETGTLLSATDTTLIVGKAVRHGFDAYGAKIKSQLEVAGNIQALEQFSYTARNQLECTARRMNAALFTAPPASACTLGSSGSYGADRIVRNEYDVLGRVSKTESGYGTVDAGIDIEMGYSANGQVQWRKDGNGNQTTYAYDGFDRLERSTFPDGSYEQFSYDANNNQQTLRKRDGKVLTHSYDALNLRTRTDIQSESALVFTYDSLGRPSTTSVGSSSITLGYDALGRVGSSTQNGRTLGYLYDAAGRRQRLTHPDGFYVTYQYDYANALTGILEYGSTALVSYGYDTLGRVSSISRGNGQTTSIGYDNSWRLESLSHANVNTTTLAYNPASQIVSHTVSNDSYKQAMPTLASASYGVNNLNQYSSVGGGAYSYDLNGNLLSGGGWSYSYNANNRLTTASTSGTTLALSYDGQGRLETSTHNGNATTFLYDGDELIAEYSGSTLTRRYVHGAGADDPLVEYDIAGGAKQWLLTDERGSVIVESGSSAQVLRSHSYGPYGEPSSTAGTRFRYTGQIYLPGTALYYYKARVYNPSLGRFLQTDPLGYQDGMNWYAYVGNDPLNKTDPTGEIAWVAIGAVISGGIQAIAEARAGTLGSAGGLARVAVAALAGAVGPAAAGAIATQVAGRGIVAIATRAGLNGVAGAATGAGQAEANARIASGGQSGAPADELKSAALSGALFSAAGSAGGDVASNAAYRVAGGVAGEAKVAAGEADRMVQGQGAVGGGVPGAGADVSEIGTRMTPPSQVGTLTGNSAGAAIGALQPPAKPSCAGGRQCN